MILSKRFSSENWLIMALVLMCSCGSIFTKGSYAATKQAIWSEFKPVAEVAFEKPAKVEAPKPTVATTIRGTLGLGYETVKDVLGNGNQGLSSETRLTLSRKQASGLDLGALINAKKSRLTSGESTQLQGNLTMTTDRWQIKVGGDLDENQRLVGGARNQSKTSKVFTNARVKLTQNFGVGVTYARNIASNALNDSTTSKSESNDFKAILRTDLGRIRADLDLGTMKTDDPLSHTLTRINTVGLSCTTDVTGFLKLNFGSRPKYTETESDDTLRNVNSDAIDYWLGCQVGSSDGFRLSALVNLNKTDYEKADTSYQAKSLVQDYRLILKPVQVLTLRLSGNLSETRSQNASKTFSANLGFDPKKSGLIGRTSLGIQMSKVEDSSGNPRSKNFTANLANSLNLTTSIEIATNFSHSLNDTYASGSGAQTTKVDNLGLSLRQRASGRFQYGLSYGFNRRDAEGAGLNTTSTYGGNIGYRMRVAQRDFPLTLAASLTSSDLGATDIRNDETRFSTEVPFLKYVSLNFGYGLRRGTRKSSGSQTTDKTTEIKAGSKISLRQFSLDLQYSLNSPDQGSKVQSIVASGAYSLSKRLAFVSRYIQTRTSGQVVKPFNFNAGLKYTF